MININLIAERRRRKLQEMLVLRWMGMGVAIVLIAMVALNLFSIFQYSTAYANVQRAQDSLQIAKEKKVKLDRVYLELQELRPKVKLLETVRDSEGAWMTILTDLSRIIPNDVSLSSLTITTAESGLAMRVSGRARDQATVGKFMLALREGGCKWADLPTLGTVSTEITKTGMETVRFDLTVPIKGMMGGEL